MGAVKSVVRWTRDQGAALPVPDPVAEEAPLEIHLDGEPLATVLRTPGHDDELAVGFCFAEGLLALGTRVLSHVSRSGWIQLRTDSPRQRRAQSPVRRFPATSACGACGRAPGTRLPAEGPFAHAKGFAMISPEALGRLPDRLREAQPDFASTGGIHAAALWDPATDSLIVREDVGRHNAVDKLVGRAFLDGTLPLGRQVLVASGRAGHEIVQKAVAAGIPMVAAIGAPSSLAVDLALETDTTLVGFLRNERFNAYSAAWRLFPEPNPHG